MPSMRDILVPEGRAAPEELRQVQVPLLADRQRGFEKRPEMIDPQLFVEAQKELADFVEKNNVPLEMIPVFAMVLGIRLIDSAKEPCSCRLCTDCPEKEAHLGDKLCEECLEEETCN